MPLQRAYEVCPRAEAALASDVVNDVRNFLGRKQVGIVLTYIGASRHKYKRGTQYVFGWDKHPDVQGPAFLRKRT